MSAVLKMRASLTSLPEPNLSDFKNLKLVREVSRKTFKRHVETSAYFEAADILGYERQYQKGETLAGSNSVTFYRGTILDGETCWVLHDSYHGYMVFRLSDYAREHNKQYS